MNEAFTIIDRDVTLSGLLVDGSAFSFDLNSVNQAGQGFFAPGATLTVTLVLPGDTDADGDVDADDLNNVRNNFGTMGPDDGTLVGDVFPFDGMVNIIDLNGVRNNFGAGAPVPEPSTLALASLFAFVAVVARRRRG